MPQLDFSTFLPQIFWLSITFIICLLGMTRFFVPKFNHLLEKRHHFIVGHEQKAKELNDEINAVSQKIQKELDKAHHDAQELLHQALLQTRESQAKQLAIYEDNLTKKKDLACLEIKEAYHAIQVNLDYITKEVIRVILSKLSFDIPSEAIIEETIQAIKKEKNV